MATSDYYIQDNSDIEDKKLEAAKGLYQTGNYSGALKLYLDMVNTSYSHKLHYEIGRCYYKMNDFDNALIYFNNSISLESNKNPSYVFLGNIYYKQQNSSKAIECWCIAHSFRPDDEAVCLNLATSYFSKDMRFQAIMFYEKYLKYAKDKAGKYYQEIKKSIEEFARIGNDFYQKTLRAISMNDDETAIQALEYSVKNYPVDFDTNFLLGKLYLKEKKYMQALIYLKQALCIDNKSLDVLEKLSSAMIELGDFTGAYCCLKRILPLVINNQKEYLEIIRNLKQLEDSFDAQSYQGHEHWGNRYYDDNNYHLAIFEYENALIMNGRLDDRLREKLDRMRLFINPEERIIKNCFEKGMVYHSTGDFKTSNKYFTKIMSLSDDSSSEYKLAKARLVNA